MGGLQIQKINPNKEAEWPEEINTASNLDPQFDHQIENKYRDTMISCQPTLETSIQEERKSASFLNKMAQLFSRKSTEIQPAPITATEKADQVAIERVGTIERAPLLSPPDPLKDQEMQRLLDSKDPLPSFAVQDKSIPLLSADSLQTKEEILAFITSIKDAMAKVMYLMQGQLELEDSQGAVSQNALDKFQKIKKELDKQLEKLADDLNREQNIAKYLGYAQTAAGLATAICTIALFIPGAQATVLPLIGTIGAVAGAIATGGKTFFDAKALQHQSEADRMEFSGKRNQNMMQNSLDRISQAVENANQIQDLLIKMIRVNDQVKRMVIRN